jgi:hypothetical protein
MNKINISSLKERIKIGIKNYNNKNAPQTKYLEVWASFKQYAKDAKIRDDIHYNRLLYEINIRDIAELEYATHVVHKAIEFRIFSITRHYYKDFSKIIAEEVVK